MLNAAAEVWKTISGPSNAVVEIISQRRSLSQVRRKNAGLMVHIC